MHQTQPWRLDLGAYPVGPSSVRFRVWAPYARTVSVRIEEGNPTSPIQEPILMLQQEGGYHEATIAGLAHGTRYRYLLDGKQERPDPASRAQPEGIHGPSAFIDPDQFIWSDQNWTGLPLHDLIIYELHVGTFSAEGSFRGIIPFLDYLRNELGITAIELMPVAQFPGARNWGYDGVFPFAPQSTYGGPDGLKELVNACHRKGLAVILDVVYNHLGPEGNYLEDFGPYFTDRYRTPWGKAINYDGPESDEVRRYIVSNALYWVTEYHIDALRLDAIHGIYDFSAVHMLRELADAVHTIGRQLGRSILVIGESDLNDVRVIAPPTEGGYGLDAQWSDDFHHALHTVLTGERAGYYEDFGRLDQLAAALQEGFVYSGQRSPHRRRRHGNSARHRPPSQFVVYAQNHDQIGNRAFGDRLTTLVSFDALKVAAAAVLLAPNTPLLFMGEEYGETAPFQYFIDHGDPSLVEAVRKGRCAEFAAFGWTEVPDPQDPATFERSRIHPGEPHTSEQTALLRWYRTLIELRKTIPALGTADPDQQGHRVYTYDAENILTVHRWAADGQAILLILGFNKAPVSVMLKEPMGEWHLRLNGSNRDFGGNDQASPSEMLAIPAKGAKLDLPPYAVRLYLKR